MKRDSRGEGGLPIRGKTGNPRINSFDSGIFLFPNQTNTGKRKTSQHSFQYPLEGYKCLGDYFRFLITMHSPDFLFVVTGFQE